MILKVMGSSEDEIAHSLRLFEHTAMRMHCPYPERRIAYWMISRMPAGSGRPSATICPTAPRAWSPPGARSSEFSGGRRSNPATSTCPKCRPRRPPGPRKCDRSLPVPRQRQKHFITRFGSGNSRYNGPTVPYFHGDGRYSVDYIQTLRSRERYWTASLTCCGRI